MNLFGKLKNSGPPALPRRRDDSAQPKTQQEENDDEEEYGGMYEAPPCERLINVPQRKKEENIYLERTCNTAPRQRPTPPPVPNFTKSLFGDTFLNSQKPPDVDRTDKPGKKKMSVPITASPQPEENVYLDPCEEQDSSEDLYLEPAEAYGLHPSEGKTMPPFFKPALPSPEPMLKPPLPPDKSSSSTATAPEVAARRFKPRPPTNQKESRPDPSVLENKPAGGKVQKSPVENREWFAEDCNRKMAEDLLLSVKKDGAFLVRNSSTQNYLQPYTLAVLYQHKVYNIPVRFLDDAQGYALGKEGKKNEEVFNTLDDVISFHKNNKLLLIDSKSQARHTTYLSCAVHP